MSAEPSTPTRFCPLCDTRLDSDVCPVDLVPTVRADFDEGARDDAALGRIIAGRFRVERLLGQGATGRVYAATQLSVERPVALKLLQPHHARDRHHVRRFYREARAATRLDSPHVVRVYDFGVDDDTMTPFIAMELLRGETLRDCLRREGPRPPGVAARVAHQIACALVAAAGAGIVHRDLKPANIMLVPDAAGVCVVKVTDFGVAKDLERHDDTETLTQRGATIGTPAYMAPEQVTGSAVSAQTDLYALGCVLYELLTGRPPFASDARAGLLVDHLLTPVAPLPDPLPSGDRTPAGLDALLTRLLAKAPADRPESAEVVAATLLDFADATVAAPQVPAAAAPAGSGAGTLTREAPAWAPPPSVEAVAPPGAKRRRNRALWAVAAVAALAGGAYAVRPGVTAADGAARPTLAAGLAQPDAPAEEMPLSALMMSPVVVSQLVVRGGGTVSLHQGAAQTLSVAGDPRRVSAALDGDRLTLTFAAPEGDVEEAEVVVNVWSPAWTSLNVAGGATVVSAEPLVFADFSLGLSGSARVELGLRGEALTTSLRGSSEATLHGTVTRHDARIAGASRLSGDDLETTSTSLTAAGTSEATVLATQTLDLRNDGGGEVIYLGEPAQLTRTGRGIRAAN